MKACFSVMRHEIIRLLKDRKTLLSIVLMPIICGIMAMLISGMDTGGSTEYTIWFAGCEVTETVQELEGGLTLNLRQAGMTAAELLRSGSFKKTDVLVDMNSGRIVYNSAGGAGDTLLYMAVDMVEESYRTSFETMLGSPEHRVVMQDNNAETDTSTIMMAVFLPYMMILTLFTNVLSYASDSIAGEKERGCFEKTLLTPVDPSSVILGKTCSGIVIGLVSTLLYVLGIVGSSEITGSASIFDPSRIDSSSLVLIALCAVIIAYLFSTVLVLCSLFAKTSKAARTNALPVMAVAIILSLFSIMRAGTVGVRMYCIPIYNICILIQDILMGQAEMLKMTVSIGSLLVCAVIAFIISCRTFNSEKIRL